MAAHDRRQEEGVEPGGGPAGRDPILLRWIDRVSEATGYLSGACILLATLIICYAVVLRAAGQSTTWQTELAVYLLIFVTFVGGAYGLKHGSHVNVDAFSHWLPAKGRLLLEVGRAVLSLTLITVVAWFSFQMWWEATVEESTSGTAWDPPLTYIYAILPLGMTLIGLQYLALITRTVLQLVGRAEDSTDEGAS